MRTTIVLALLLSCFRVVPADPPTPEGPGGRTPPPSSAPPPSTAGPAGKTPLPITRSAEKPLTVEKAADAALAAIKAKDTDALKSRAAKDDPDPWLVADELIARGEFDVAEAFAKAAPRKDVEALPAYVHSRRGKPTDSDCRRDLSALKEALLAGDITEALRLAESPSCGTSGIGAIRLSVARAAVFRAANRRSDSVVADSAAAEGAEQLGWLLRAARSWHNAGLTCATGGEFLMAVPAWEKRLLIEVARENRDGVASTRGNIGSLYESLGNYEKALEYLNLSLREQEALGDRSGVAITLGNIGNVHFSKYEFAKALEFHSRALRENEALGDRAGVALMLGNIGGVYRSLKDYVKALEYGSRALEELRGIGDRSGVANALGNIGNAYFSLGRYREALAFQQRSLDENSAIGDRAGIAHALDSVGSVLSAMGLHSQSIYVYERAIALGRELGYRSEVAMARGNLGTAHEALRQYELALQSYTVSRQEEQALGNARGASKMLESYARVQHKRSAHASALATYETARREFQAQGEQSLAAACLSEMGGVLESIGNGSEALQAHKQAHAEMDSSGDRAGAAQTLAHLAGSYSFRGDHERALSTYAQALLEMISLDHRPGAAAVFANIASEYVSIGDFAKALDALARARSILELAGDRKGAARILIKLGTTHLAIGDTAKAIEYEEIALKEMDELGDVEGMAHALGDFANAQVAAGDIVMGLASYQRAAVRMADIGDRRGAALVLLNVGRAQIRAGDPAKAVASLVRAQKEFEYLGDVAGATRASGERGVALVAQGDLTGGLELLKSAVTQAEQLGAGRDLLDLIPELVAAHFRSGQWSEVISIARRAVPLIEQSFRRLGDEQGSIARGGFAELFAMGILAGARSHRLTDVSFFLESGRARALLESLQSREAIQSVILPPEVVLGENQRRRAESAAIAALSEAVREGNLGVIAARRKEVDAARERVRESTERIQRDAKAAASVLYPQVVSPSAMRRLLSRRDAFITYATCLDEALALIVTSDGERLVPLGPMGPINQACEALHPDQRDGDVAQRIKRLRDLIVAPLLLTADIDRILISPEGELAYVPFALLIPTKTVAYVASGTAYEFLLQDRMKRGEQVLALGDPDYGKPRNPVSTRLMRGEMELSPLPETRKEAIAIGDVTLLGTEATEAGLVARLKDRVRWRSVHLACHGFLNSERPGFSSLALTPSGEDDGFFTTFDVFRTKIPTDLVVLSACNTARGKTMRGEGVVGLTRAFMFAGSPRVICSLWKVDDEATRALMSKFYSVWNPKDGSPGMETAAALRAAQESVSTQEKWKHPFYWGAWVLWGLAD